MYKMFIVKLLINKVCTCVIPMLKILNKYKKCGLNQYQF